MPLWHGITPPPFFFSFLQAVVAIKVYGYLDTNPLKIKKKEMK
jgi:hypothetical protein